MVVKRAYRMIVIVSSLLQGGQIAYAGDTLSGVANHQPPMVDMHRIPLQGALNFRDLGGYRTVDGKVIKRGLLYRSDTLSYLTDSDQQFIERLNIKRIVDFRGDQEVQHSPDKLPGDLVAARVNIPVSATQQGGKEFVRLLSSGDTSQLDSLMSQGYPAFVRQYSPAYRVWLHGLLQVDDGAQLFHCTGGRDRTGFAAAVLLLSLGVSKQTVMDDFLASNRYLQPGMPAALGWQQRLRNLYGIELTDNSLIVLQAKAAYLQAAFDAMEQDYGSINNYLRVALGVDDAFRARLRQRFLTSPKNFMADSSGVVPAPESLTVAESPSVKSPL